ncbi:MAG: hypothetical protein QW244_03015 [Candidatus Pacearchaeota archaeon]
MKLSGRAKAESSPETQLRPILLNEVMIKHKIYIPKENITG